MKKTKLRIQMEAKKLTAVDLGKKVKCVSVRTIQSIAQGVREPSIEAAREIARALKMPVDKLFS